MYIDILIIIITFPYSTTCISSLFGSSIPISLFVFKIYFCLLFLCNIENVAQRTFEIGSKIKITRI